MERVIDGPLTPGSSIPAWRLRQSRLYADRPKPQNIYALLGDPSYLLSLRTYTTYKPAVDSLGNSFDGTFLDNFVIPNNVYTELKARTASKLRGKIKGEKWNLSTFMGELPQTMKYFCSALSEVMRAYQAVKRGDLRSIKRLAKRGKRWLKRRGLTGSTKDTAGLIAKRWLEFRYAISPLVYDLQDMLGYLYRASTRPIISRSASGAEAVHTKRVKGKATENDYTERFELKGRGVVYFSVNPHAEAFKQLGLINIAAALWELTPLSFVADMFLPIGERIAHLDAMAGVDFFGGTYSVLIAGESFTIDKVVKYPGSKPPYWNTLGSSHYKVKQYERHPGIIYLTSPPTYSEHPTVKQTLDIIALARTMLFK